MLLIQATILFTGTTSLTLLGYYVDNANETNQFNTTVGGVAQGNYYFNITSLALYDSDSDGWGDSGDDYPLNATSWAARWNNLGADWGPYTTNESAEDAIDPISSLGTNPIDTYNSSSSSVTFDIKSSDDTDVNTIQLFGNWSGSWVANYTNSSYTNNTWLNISVFGIADGYYVWGVFSNDSAGNSDWSVNRTLTVDTPKTYYVSNNTGSDSNNGTSEDFPWQTLAYAEVTAITPGDIIALKKGDVWLVDNVFEITQRGNSTHDITWDGGLWGTGNNAVIQANSDGGSNPIWLSTIRIVDSQYVTFQNIKIDGQGYERYGLVIGGGDNWDGPTAQNNEHHITIQDSEITNFGSSATYQLNFLVRPYYNNISNITIQRNNFSVARNHGIAFYPQRVSQGASGAYAIIDSYIGYNNISNFGEDNDGVVAGIMINNKWIRISQ